MSRAEILSKIKRAAGPGDDAQRRKTVEARLAAPPLHALPARAKATAKEARAAFVNHMTSVGTAVFEVAAPADIPGAIAKYVAEIGLGNTIVIGEDAWLGALPWSTAPKLAIESWKPGPPPVIALSRAAAGIAESGTLILASGPDNPASLNYLPEAHIAVLEAGKLFAGMEAAFATARQRASPNGMPRTLALVSSPSRTADVGGKLVRGAHGPKRFAVILVG